MSLNLLQIVSQIIFIFYGNCAGAGAVLPRTLKMGARAGAVRAPKWGARLGAKIVAFFQFFENISKSPRQTNSFSCMEGSRHTSDVESMPNIAG